MKWDFPNLQLRNILKSRSIEVCEVYGLQPVVANGTAQIVFGLPYSLNIEGGMPSWVHHAERYDAFINQVIYIDIFTQIEDTPRPD